MINAVKIIKFVENEVLEQEDLVIKEYKANIYVNGKYYSSLMCLPQHFSELAAGFLFSEGVIGSYADVVKIESTSAGDVFVEAAPVSGGVRGLPEITSTLKISSDEVVKMAASFNDRSELFLKTGAVHSCALALPDGEDLFYEDVGRNNALDKIIGKALMANLCLKNAILLTSGRVSSEVLLKAARAGIPVIISVSAPTSMAIELAGKMNIALIGFARGRRFNVYAGEHRVMFPANRSN